MSYYHGGRGGLKRGEFILPSATTKASSLRTFGGISRADKVYVVTDERAALMYAALHPSMVGCVYQVEPVGVLEPDPDCNEAGLSFSCDRARIVKVHKVPRALRDEFLKTLMKEHAVVGGQL